MWDTIKTILGVVGPIVSGIFGAGPFGMIAAALGAVALGIGAIVIINKIKQRGYDKAHNKTNENATEGHNETIDLSQKISKEDKKALDQSKKDKDNAFKGE